MKTARSHGRGDPSEGTRGEGAPYLVFALAYDSLPKRVKPSPNPNPNLNPNPSPNPNPNLNPNPNTPAPVPFVSFRGYPGF